MTVGMEAPVTIAYVMLQLVSEPGPLYMGTVATLLAKVIVFRLSVPLQSPGLLHDAQNAVPAAMLPDTSEAHRTLLLTSINP